MSASRIVALPESVKKMIAAGEVVEGPHSVVKELLENSIDSNADEISVFIEESGTKKIVITDNGSGIAPDQISLALEEHATSKISTLDDIQGVQSYGFRGEALSSISSIAHLTIMSRPVEEEVGAKLVCRGESKDLVPYAGPAGTTLIVEHLFYNTPARKKFMKSRSVESRYIKDIFFKLALPHFDRRFSLKVDDKKPLVLEKCLSLEERIAAIYGKDDFEGLYFDSVTDMKVHLSGAISKPSHQKRNRSMQLFYVNNRPVDYKYLSFHLQRAYDSMLPKGAYPAAILFLKIPTELVDVNVHPAKREVKIFDSSYIDTLVYGFAKKVLGSHENTLHISPVEDDESVSHKEEETDSKPASVQSTTEDFLPFTQTVYHKTLDKSFDLSEKTEYNDRRLKTEDSVAEGKRLYQELESEYRVIGTLLETYILVETRAALKIVDFHAAHERIIFDRLKSKKGEYESQALMFPEEYAVSMQQKSVVDENLTLLQEKGFDIDWFSDDSLVVNALPLELKISSAKTFLDDYFDRAARFESSGSKELETIEDELLERIACHSAKRAHDEMSREESIHLIEQVFSGKYELRCPHGRPFVVTVSEHEVEKLFKRSF